MEQLEQLLNCIDQRATTYCRVNVFRSVAARMTRLLAHYTGGLPSVVLKQVPEIAVVPPDCFANGAIGGHGRSCDMVER